LGFPLSGWQSGAAWFCLLGWVRRSRKRCAVSCPAAGRIGCKGAARRWRLPSGFQRIAIPGGAREKAVSALHSATAPRRLAFYCDGFASSRRPHPRNEGQSSEVVRPPWSAVAEPVRAATPLCMRVHADSQTQYCGGHRMPITHVLCVLATWLQGGWISGLSWLFTERSQRSRRS
jgi:hypothetical protein